MKKAGYTILNLMLHGLALLPFWMLYLLSDFLYFIMCHVVKYRRKVISKNLSDSFPEKSEHEIKKITKKFYRNFSDYIVETIKLLHISDREMKKRMQFENVELIDSLLSQGASIAAYFSHCFNWEWAPSVTLWSSLQNYKLIGHPEIDANGKNEVAAYCQIYRPLKDKWFDALMLKVRDRFNPISVAKAHTLRHLLTLRRDGVPSITGFMSDQKPSHGDPAEVVMFLNHPTAMITGTETVARRLKMAAIYWDMHKLSRGHYKIVCRLIATDVSATEPMQVTDTYAQLLQATILRDPAIWLWSHNRWKIPVSMPTDK